MIVEKAKRFARQKHSEINHLRRYTDLPYITHPAVVVSILKTIHHTDDMLAAAWLHDTVEDTDTTLDEIYLNFNDEIGDLVEMLTDVSKPSAGNREIRKALDREHITKASSEAKTIKLADLIDNSESIIQHDPKFAKVYMKEKALLLEVLKEGDKQLWLLAKAIVDKYFNNKELKW